MKFYESQTLERIGFDFYCDIANNIVKARKEKQLTQGKATGAYLFGRGEKQNSQPPKFRSWHSYKRWVLNY